MIAPVAFHVQGMFFFGSFFDNSFFANKATMLQMSIGWAIQYTLRDNFQGRLQKELISDTLTVSERNLSRSRHHYCRRVQEAQGIAINWQKSDVTIGTPQLLRFVITEDFQVEAAEGRFLPE